MKFAKRKSRRAIAGIVATVIMFAILFTVGTSYFIFVNGENASYVQNLVSASNKLQSANAESLQVTTVAETDGDIGFYVNDTSGLNVNMTAVYVLASTGGLLKCDGVGLPASASCSNTTPSLWAEVNAGKASATFDTGYLYTSGTTDTVKVITQRGNVYSATYPDNALSSADDASTSQALQINLATYKWVQLVPQATSLVQKAYGSCTTSTCVESFGSGVSAADTLVYALGWYNHAAPTSVTDSQSDSFTLSASQSVPNTNVPPTLVQDAYASNCNSNSCGKQFGSSVTQGNTLVYGLGWYSNSAPSTPTDSLSDSFTLGPHSSVVGSGSPAYVQKAFTASCSFANSCGQAFGSQVTAHNVLVYALGWTNHAPPTSVIDSLGNPYSLVTSENLPGTPTQYTQANEKYCDNKSSCAAGKLANAQANDIVVLAIGWYSHADPTSVTDTFGSTFTQAIEKTVVVSGTTYYSDIYYAVCSTCNNDDIITANFASPNVASVSVSAYEITGASTTGLQTSSGSSSSGVTTASVTSFTPASGSYVIGSVETSGAPTFAAVSPYAIPATGACNGGDDNGCSESASISAATTAQMTLTSSVGFAESAISFPSQPNYYNSYIWDATTSSSGSDTVTATFSSPVTGSTSVYEVSQATTSGAQSSTGSSTSGPATSTVSSFTPATNSFVIGNTEVGTNNPAFTAGSGYTIISPGGGGCNANQGCSEYQAGVGSATTVSMTLGGGENTWVEAAISLPPASITYDSYIWYATAANSGSDTISALFGSTAVGSVSIYEISGAVIVSPSPTNSTGSSSAGSTTSAVSSFAVNSDSILVANTETGGTTFTAGGSYTLDGPCSSVYGCSEYQTGVSGSKTAPMTLNPSTPWVEVAAAFSPLPLTFYSYIWTTTAATAGGDTITATFSSAVAASASIYDLSGYNIATILSSTGTSSAGSTSVSVTSFTPYLSSIIIGNTESAAGSAYTAGAGLTLVAACNGVYGCSESQTGVSSATTAPMTLNSATPWVESAISIGAQINPQSGYQVGGYPSLGVPDEINIAWHANFTNTDPEHRSVTLWPQSEISLDGLKNGGKKHFDYFIIDGVNQAYTGLVAYPDTPANFITVPYGQTVQLWFAASAPLTTMYANLDFDVDTPFQALFSLSGVFSDGSLYGETIPYPTGVIHQANAQESISAGNAGTIVTVSCTGGNCGYKLSSNAMIGWINDDGVMTVLTTFVTTNNGGIPAGTKFTVPTATDGYYTIMISDYINTYFLTFQKTG